MITFRWFGKLREFSVAPVIITSVDNYAADAGTMPADPFGSGLNHHVRTMLQRTEQVTRSAKSIIYDQWQIVFFSYRSYLFKIRNIVFGVANRFQVNGFGFSVD